MEALTMQTNNTVNIFLIILNIFYNNSFIKYLWISKTSLVLIDL